LSFPFASKHGPILIDAEVTGPVRSMPLSLILDTGATTTLIKEAVLLALGDDLASVTDRAPMTTGSVVTSVPRVVLTRLSALGQHRFGIPVLAHTLPASVSASGPLGLDF
jgi:Aspartyl protease